MAVGTFVVDGGLMGRPAQRNPKKFLEFRVNSPNLLDYSANSPGTPG